MATRTIEEYLPKTAAYINDNSISKERAGHHNYCVEQKICNASPALAFMSSAQLKSFDDEMLKYLKYLDQEA